MPAKVNATGRSTDVDAGSAVDSDGPHVRGAYERAIDSYKVAETKAQLVLTVNGILATILLVYSSEGLMTQRKLLLTCSVLTRGRSFLLRWGRS
jgi:hypothetical protein